MLREAPLQVPVEILLEGGPAAGRRRFRLCRSIALPPLLRFDRELPVEGSGRGRVRFDLPDEQRIEARALLRFDPEHPERGAVVELESVAPAAIEAILHYIEQRLTP